MKSIFFSILLMLICWGAAAQRHFKKVTPKGDIYITYATIPPTHDTLHYGTDSAAYYRLKYKHFMDLYTNSIGYKEVTRMGDSCKKYYELLNRKKK